MNGKRGNLVLIGMPGCGKSTVSGLVADALRLSWYDADAVIEEKAGMPVTDIFERYGETYFRELETECLTKLLKQENIVVAAGGGAILRNAALMRENALVVYLKRDIEDILSDLLSETRPLLKDDPVQRLSAMYESRREYYESGCDLKVDNTGDIRETAERLAEMYYAYFGR